MRRKWRERLFALLKSVAIIAVAIAVAMIVNVGLDWLKFGDLVHRIAPHLDSTMAQLIADSLATSATVYLSIYYVQIKAIDTLIRDNLFGLDGIDLKKAVLREIIPQMPPFHLADRRHPLVICNDPVAMRKQLAAIVPGEVVFAALGMELWKVCAG